ncbi:MAG: hypothetical protein GON13_02230 [Nanoarchaeota archaeon]|nr:hypothetical protein [Nanoarchaeota archaeon]
MFVELLVLFALLVVGFVVGKWFENQKWISELPEIRSKAIERSRAVLKGQFSEQIAPFLPDFPWSPSEARFIGKPIDFLIFKGADKKSIDEVVFVEVKSGKSQLSSQEKKLKEVIKNKKVSWVEYRVPDFDKF